ncbi:MAG TPA: gliding motility-associated ABC transporter substrate-binding protein GldG [Chitinophagaceae bacterium]|jgi:gliding-associated putative ABC transporter substrate-binding component GldG|nr:gliding motility-associated ABC transporter substrate-binding protein GldG [Chitinophagaceae bacterium]
MRKIIASKFWLIFLLLILVGINFLAAVFHSRLDLTKEKRYTLSKASGQIIKNLSDVVYIDVFLKGDFPAGFKKLSKSTEEFLQLLKDRNSSKIQYNFISPEEEIPNESGKRYADTLTGLGAYSINLTVQIKEGQKQQMVFPVALIHYKDKQALVNLYSGGKRVITQQEINDAEALMEYQFIKTLDDLIDPSKPLMAYSIGNGEPTGPETYDLWQTLSKNYQLFTINLETQKFISDTFSTLIIVKPSRPFNDQEKLKIDQFVMRGGRVLLFIDELFAEQDSLRFKSQVIAYDRGLNLEDLLFKYGVRINTDLVMDLQCDYMKFIVGGNASNPQEDYLHWNYYPLFSSDNNHSVNRNLGLVEGRFVNSIDTVKAPGVKKTFLLRSSPNSRIISTPAIISLNENKNAPQNELFKQSNIPVAALLEGHFTSFYKNRIGKAERDSLESYGIPFRDACETENKIIVVADGDMVLNDFSQKYGPLPMGLNISTIDNPQYSYQFANREFLMNSIEYLTDKPGIIEMRNKNIILRLLDSKKVKEQKTTWQFINIALPVLLIILFGFIYQQLRKKKYATS